MFNDLDLYNKKNKKLILKSVTKTIDKNNFIFDQNVDKLEKRLSKFTGSKYVCTVGSGTDALLLSLLSLNLKKGDEIIIPSFSWLSVVEVVLFLNLKPIFTETNLVNFNLNIEHVKKLISKRTKAIITTSLFGRTCDLEKIKSSLPKKIKLIEDGAQNFGSILNGKSSLNIADISCTSFFPSKNLGSFGDGGAIFTNNNLIYKRIKMLRNHGQLKYSITATGPGINSRLGSIQATVLLEKLKKIKSKITSQIRVYEKYQKFFIKNNIVGFPKIRIKSKMVDALSAFNLVVKNRNKLINIFKKKNIPFKIYYPKPLYDQYNLKYKNKLKNTEFLCNSIISLPFNDLSQKRFNLIKYKLEKIIKKNKKIFFQKV
ncbi:aminotransferase class I/II-fold pyridoxal phosphate-dependent enzyme [Candidatus Pelagibacter sp.]|nr:aminotransferase class I/II-fold pyridoxal phosphate-dependent enzyme [Candidatus Pelagibacter sp.]